MAFEAVFGSGKGLMLEERRVDLLDFFDALFVERKGREMRGARVF